MPNTLSHESLLYQVEDARVSAVTADNSTANSQTITGVTNSGTTVTAVVASTTGMAAGVVVNISGITGFTTNNPNGRYRIATVVDATHFTYVAAAAPTGAYGSGGTAQFGVYTTGASVLVPGIKTVGLTPAFNRKEARGAGQQMAVRSKRTGHALTFGFEKLSLDAFSVMTGDAVVATGSDPNSVVTYRATDTGVALPYFKFEAETSAVDAIGGDYHLVIYKCVLDASTLGFAEEDFHVFTCGGSAMRRDYDFTTYDQVLNQAAQLIA